MRTGLRKTREKNDGGNLIPGRSVLIWKWRSGFTPGTPAPASIRNQRAPHRLAKIRLTTKSMKNTKRTERFQLFFVNFVFFVVNLGALAHLTREVAASGDPPLCFEDSQF